MEAAASGAGVAGAERIESGGGGGRIAQSDAQGEELEATNTGRTHAPPLLPIPSARGDGTAKRTRCGCDGTSGPAAGAAPDAADKEDSETKLEPESGEPGGMELSGSGSGPVGVA